VPTIPGPSVRDFRRFPRLRSRRGFLPRRLGLVRGVVVFAVFNSVLGEELLLRLLLPKMQGVLGRRDWVPHGALFAVYHLHQP